MLDRRSFLAASAAGAVSLAVGCKPAAEIVKSKVDKIGIQTYTLRELFSQDALSTLKMIKDVGYDYVELNRRNFTQVPALELRAMLDRVGLPAPSSHISYDMIQGDMGELIETSKVLGLKYVTVPWMNEDVRSLSDWQSHARLMDKAGKELRDNGLHLAYHNHQFEFDDLGGGTTAMDILLNECAPEHLTFELDLFWAYLAGVDIPQFFNANPGRFKLCHIKDMGPNKADFVNADYPEISSNLMKNVGEGVMPFEAFFAENKVSGMEYFIAEHDSPPKPYKRSVQQCYNAIKQMRF